MTTDPDHSLFEMYVNGSLWRTVNGYTPQAGVTTLEITLSREGPHHIEVCNRHDRDLRATGHKLRFHKLESNRAYDLHTWVQESSATLFNRTLRDTCTGFFYGTIEGASSHGRG